MPARHVGGAGSAPGNFAGGGSGRPSGGGGIGSRGSTGGGRNTVGTPPSSILTGGADAAASDFALSDEARRFAQVLRQMLLESGTSLL